jgi:hypothetical protein
LAKTKGLKRGRKEISIFHHHVVPLVRDEIANDGIDSLPKNFTIREHVLDRVSDAAQAFSPLSDRSFGLWQRDPCRRHWRVMPCRVDFTISADVGLAIPWDR